MARPTTVFIDGPRLLAGIVREYESELSDMEAAIASYRPGESAWQQAHRTLAHLKSYGLRIDFARFYGKPLTKTEAQKCGRFMNDYEAAGNLVVQGDKPTWIRPTDAGRAWLAQQQPAATKPVASPFVDPLSAAQE